MPGTSPAMRLPIRVLLILGYSGMMPVTVDALYTKELYIQKKPGLAD